MRTLRRATAAGALVVVACLVWAFSSCQRRREVRPPEPPALPYLGSGTLVTEDGHFLTVARVVAGARTLQVVISEQDRRHRTIARVIASDPSTGLVLCRAEAARGWALAWTDSAARVSDARVACGWPFVALAAGRRHERELSLRSCSGGDTPIGFPLAPGFEGGPVTTSDGVGLGIVAATSRAGDVMAQPDVVPAAAVLEFLRAHGVDPVMARRRRTMAPRALAARMIWSVVRVEGEPADPSPAATPCLLWSARITSDEVLQLRFASGGPAHDEPSIEARVWEADGAERIVTLHGSDGAVVGRAAAPATDARPRSRTARSRAMDFRLDALGRLTATDRATGRPLYEASERNGGQGIGSWDAPSLSRDGRLLLVGDAVVWTHSGTVLWRLARRLDRPAALSPDGSAIAVARDARTVELWRLPGVRGFPAVTPSGKTSPAGQPAARPARRP